MVTLLLIAICVLVLVVIFVLVTRMMMTLHARARSDVGGDGEESDEEMSSEGRSVAATEYAPMPAVAPVASGAREYRSFPRSEEGEEEGPAVRQALHGYAEVGNVRSSAIEHQYVAMPL